MNENLFTDQILAEIARGEGKYWRTFLLNQKELQGITVTDLKSHMRELGWKSLGSNGEFETLCERVGFKVYRAQNQRRNWARVVTV